MTHEKIPPDELKMSVDELLEATREQPDYGKRYLDLCDRFHSLGYHLAAMPFPSTYEGFCEVNEKALAELLNRAEDMRKAHGFRGWSKPLMNYLHHSVPEPVFGVELRKDIRQ